MRTHFLRLISLIVVVCAFGAASSVASAQVPAPAPVPAPKPPDPRGVSPQSANPLLGLPLFVDHKLPAYRQYRYYLHRHRRGLAHRLTRLAHAPQFRWFGRWNHPPRRAVKKFIQRASQQHQVAQIAVLRAQAKRCSPSYPGGGRREDARTRKWYRNLARGIGHSRVVIAFEPDSIGTLNCQAKSRRKPRLKLLRYGVETLSKLPNATIYLEGGASDWEPPARTAKLLRMIGIGKVRGFMLNVTHYDWTARNIAYGAKVSRRTGGKHFVISTAFNGRGPVHFRRRVSGRVRRINVWCHPLKRGLGPLPSTTTARPGLVDAYLYIGRPGFSGGSCNGGPKHVGAWWPKRALMSSYYATQWIRPPGGTRNGFAHRFSLSQLGAPR